MNQHRFVAFVATALVLYVLASVGAAQASFDAGALALVLVGVACSIAPLWVARSESSLGPSLVGRLSAAVGLLLAGLLAFEGHALLGELVSALCLPMVGVLSLRLALTVPDTPPRLARHARSEGILRVIAGLVGLLGLAAALPPVWIAGRALIAPHWYSRVPLGFALAAVVLATLLRLTRRRLGSDARALSANMWASLGSALALALLALLVGARAWVAPSPSAERVVIAVAFALYVVGHVWLVSPSRALVASAWARELFALSVAFAAAAAVFVSMVPHWASDVLARVLLCALALSVFEGSRVLVRKLAFALLAPHRGLLLAAIDDAAQNLSGAATYDLLAARVLRPLRRASGSPEAAPLFVSFHPVREVRLDAAGQPRASVRPLSAAIEQRLRELRGEAVVRADLAGRLVRRPELRDLVWALDELDALCVVPLMTEGELEGALVVARGARKHPLSLEELTALDRLARLVSPLASVFLMGERANQRTAEATMRANELAQRVTDLEDELVQARAQANLLKASRANTRAMAQTVAYSPAMRELMSRLEAAAAHDVSVLLVSEPGTELVPLTRKVHDESGRRDAAFVVGHCADLSLDGALGVLLGSADGPGWLELADDGTLVLLDVAALGLDAQRALSDAIAEKRARALGTTAAYPVRARIVATAQRPLTELVAVGAVGPELARWLEPVSFAVPPLRERREDLESLLLMALDRAARVLGREVPGLEPDALHALVDYDWPGNLAELESVVQRAVAAATGPRITLADLPPLTAGSASAGSFLDQERDILRRALERAGGNKTRAARALGLKRTTLIDKLRRLGLEETPRRTEH